MTIDQTPRDTAPRIHTVTGGGGVRLHVREWGRPDGTPILLLHGWSGSQLCWRHQAGGRLADEFRLVAPDLRGHGMSERPPDAAGYQDGGLWADDVAAVVDQLQLDHPVLVGWSYAGFIVADYLRAHGQDAIAGINFVGAAVVLNQRFDHIGPGFLHHAPGACDPDLATNIAAIRPYLRALTAEAMDQEDWDAALCWTMVVPPEVRGALLSRQLDAGDVLPALTVPVLVTHGRQDTIVLPSMAEHLLEVCPDALVSWYDHAGHTPFLEDRERFDRELADFTRQASR